MKKNKMMRAASALLVATLLTTSVISGTFAKYTTQDSASDVARVAKWGVNLSVAGDLYGSQYKTGTTAPEAITNADGLTVKATDSTNVVAPGTKSADNGLSFSLTGKPEVSSKVTATVAMQDIFLAEGDYGVMVEAKGVTAENFASYDKLFTLSGNTYTKADTYTDTDTDYYTLEDAVTTDNYYPVVYSLAGDTATENTNCSADSAKAVAEKLLGAMGSVPVSLDTNNLAYYGTTTSSEYAPKTVLEIAGPKLNKEVLTWEWAFGNIDKVGNSAELTDRADTILGNLMSGTGVTNVVFATKGTDGTIKDSYTAIEIQNWDADVDKHIAEYTYAVAGSEKVACLTTQFYLDITVTQID